MICFYRLSNQKALSFSVRLLTSGSHNSIWFCSSHSLAFLWCVLVSVFFPSFPLSSNISYLPTRLEDERRFAVILGTEWGPAADLLCNLVTRLVSRVDCWEVCRTKQTIDVPVGEAGPGNIHGLPPPFLKASPCAAPKCKVKWISRVICWHVNYECVSLK